MTASKYLSPSEIATLRETLKLSEGEFASRIGVTDRQLVKLYESGAQRPDEKVHKAILRLLQRTAGRSPKLKKLLATVRSRTVDIQ